MNILLKPWGHASWREGQVGFSWLTFVVAQSDRHSDPHDVWTGNVAPWVSSQEMWSPMDDVSPGCS